EGQRALRTWRDRMQRLANLGFIGAKPGPLGELSYVVIYNPYHVIKRAYLAKQVHENKWQALVIRANEVGAFDIDDIDDKGKLIITEDDDEDDEGDNEDQDRKSRSSRNRSFKTSNPRHKPHRTARR